MNLSVLCLPGGSAAISTVFGNNFRFISENSPVEFDLPSDLLYSVSSGKKTDFRQLLKQSVLVNKALLC